MTATNRPFLRFAALWALQLLGSLLLLSLSYSWLTWPDEETWQVAASLSVGLVVVVASLWMEWIVFAKSHREAGSGYFRPLVLLAFTVCVAVMALSEVLLAGFNSDVERIGVRLAQITHMPPRATVAVLDWTGWAVFWIIIPAILLPIVSLAARNGFGAYRWTLFREALAVLRKPLYWAGLLTALLAGVYCPLRLIAWIPERSSLRGEMWSAGLRLSAAYLLAVTALVSLVWLIARLLPTEQPPVETTQERAPLVSA